MNSLEVQLVHLRVDFVGVNDSFVLRKQITQLGLLDPT